MNLRQFALFRGRVACFCLFWLKRLKGRQNCRRWWKGVLWNLPPQDQLHWPVAVLRIIWVHHLIRMDVPKTGNWGKLFRNPGFMITREWDEGRNKRCNVKRKKRLKFTELTSRFITRKQILFVVCKKSCSEAGRRHFWKFVSVDNFLSVLRQVGHTWRGQLMTGILRIFWLSKQTCLSFVPSAT